jgi:hypothetical protein
MQALTATSSGSLWEFQGLVSAMKAGRIPAMLGTSVALAGSRGKAFYSAHEDTAGVPGAGLLIGVPVDLQRFISRREFLGSREF